MGNCSDDRFAVGLSNGQVFLLNAGTGQARRIHRAGTHTVSALAFSNGGHFLAFSSNATSIGIYDTLSKSEILPVQVPRQQVIGLAFNAADSKLFCLTSDSHLIDIDTESWDCCSNDINLFDIGPRLASNIAFDCDSNSIVLAGDWVWRVDANTMRLERAFVLRKSIMEPVCLDRSGRYCGWLGVDRKLHISDLKFDRQWISSGRFGAVRLVEAASDGSLLAIATEQNGIQILVKSQVTEPLRLGGESSCVSEVCLDSSESRLAIAHGSGDYGITLWDLQQGAVVAVLKGHEGTVSGLSFSRSGEYLLSGGADGRAMLWNLALKKLSCEVVKPECNVRAVGFIDGENPIAVVRSERWLKVIYIKDSRELTLMAGEDGRATCCAISSDEPILAWGDESGNIRVQNLKNDGEPARRVKCSSNGIMHICLSTDGKTAGIVSMDDSVWIWNWEVNRIVRVGATLESPVDYVADISVLNRESCIIATSSGSVQVITWPGDAIGRLAGVGGIRCVANSRKQGCVIAGSSDGSIRFIQHDKYALEQVLALYCFSDGGWVGVTPRLEYEGSANANNRYMRLLRDNSRAADEQALPVLRVRKNLIRDTLHQLGFGAND
jgi:WD40 repeat protein